MNQNIVPSLKPSSGITVEMMRVTRDGDTTELLHPLEMIGPKSSRVLEIVINKQTDN